MYLTRLLRKPIASLKQKVKDLIAKTDSKESLKYMLYSGHDDTIANTIVFLNPVDFTLVETPFASQVYIELHYDD